jgi:hypothetical protein
MMAGDLLIKSRQEEFWAPICQIATQLRCWERLSANDGHTRWVTDWATLLIMPTADYLEVSEGPVPIRYVEWVELSTLRIKGGMAGRPRQMVDMKEDIVSHLRQTSVAWELRESTWSLKGLLDEEPVQAVRIVNPFGPKPERPS